jgi:glycerophosphoryl diester phosphodiesterase
MIVPMSRVPEWLVHIPIAHRGLHDAAHGVIENSLPAFQAASRAGYPAELDVRLLADGEIAVFHDQDLDRLTRDKGPIAALTARDLGGILLSGATIGETRIPLLRDVLDVIAGSTPLLIEVKNEGDVGELEERTRALLASYRGAYAVQSFHPGTVQYWREHAPATPRGLLSGDFRDEKIDEATRTRLRNMESIEECEPDFVGYDIRLLPNAMIEKQRAAQRRVIGWTARSRSEAERALVNCDNIIFEGFDATILRTKK